MVAYVRGSTVHFSATCLDETGVPVSPSSATVTLVYVNLAGVRTKETVAMTINGNVVSAAWDSSVASDSTLFWSVNAKGATSIVQDGAITLTANEANTPVS